MARGQRLGMVRRVAALCAAATLVIAAACGSDDDPEVDERSASSTTTGESTTTAPPTTAPPTPEEAAEAVYLEFIDTMNRLGTSAPDPDDEDLARLAIDPVLSSVRDSLTTLQAENQVWELGDRTSHQIGPGRIDDPDQAVLTDCVVENDTLIDRDDGSIVETTPLTTRKVEVKLTLLDGEWAVSAIDTITKADGEVPCGE